MCSQDIFPLLIQHHKVTEQIKYRQACTCFPECDLGGFWSGSSFFCLFRSSMSTAFPLCSYLHTGLWYSCQSDPQRCLQKDCSFASLNLPTILSRLLSLLIRCCSSHSPGSQCRLLALIGFLGCDNILGSSNLKDDRFVLVHVFRGILVTRLCFCVVLW